MGSTVRDDNEGEGLLFFNLHQETVPNVKVAYSIQFGLIIDPSSQTNVEFIEFFLGLESMCFVVAAAVRSRSSSKSR
jgi:hypothetical protein